MLLDFPSLLVQILLFRLETNYSQHYTTIVNEYFISHMEFLMYVLIINDKHTLITQYVLIWWNSDFLATSYIDWIHIFKAKSSDERAF